MTLAPSAAPPSALHTWTDGSRLYVEIPGSSAHPSYITTYNFDHRGIALMISLLGAHRIDYEHQGDTLPRTYTDTTKQPGTITQRAFAESRLNDLVRKYR